MPKLIKIYKNNPSEKILSQIVEILKNGGIIIYPTDTVYGLGCDIYNHKAMERLAQIKKIKLEKANFSFICSDLSHLSLFTKPISNSTFKLLKRALPGAFTFILNSNNKLPSFYKNKKTIGIRIPNHPIPTEIVNLLGNPIASTSTHSDDQILEYTTDPELIFEKYEKLVDLVIDCGIGGTIASTLVDMTNEHPQIIRQGKGIIEDYL